MGEFAYKLPDDNANAAAAIIESVPDDWSWCSGQIDAPLYDVEAGNVADAGYLFDDRSHFGQISIVTLIDSAYINNPSDKLLLMERRERVVSLLGGLLIPSYIKFEKTGFDSHDMGLITLHAVKNITANYVLSGYKGDLDFCSDCYDNVGHQNPAKIELHLSKWREWFTRPDALTTLEYINGEPEFYTPRREHPPLIKLTFDEKFGGTEDLLNSVISVCEQLRLEELDAKSIGAGSSYAEQLT